jgi:hypothetical protein
VEDFWLFSCSIADDKTLFKQSAIFRGDHVNTTAAARRRPQESHWLGEPVIERRGTYDQVAEAIPLFARRQFALYTAPQASDELPLLTGENPYYDEVVRINDFGEPEVPDVYLRSVFPA